MQHSLVRRQDKFCFRVPSSSINFSSLSLRRSSPACGFKHLFQLLFCLFVFTLLLPFVHSFGFFFFLFHRLQLQFHQMRLAVPPIKAASAYLPFQPRPTNLHTKKNYANVNSQLMNGGKTSINYDA